MLEITRVDILDGHTTFWREGPRIGLGEIMRITTDNHSSDFR